MIFKKTAGRLSWPFLPILLLLLFAACVDTGRNNRGFGENTKSDFTLVAEFLREDGSALGGDTVCLTLDGKRTDYPLNANGELQITGLPRNDDLLLCVLDPQGKAVGSMTLSFLEGAVIDASTSGDGAGQIALRRDTDLIALSFSLSEDGSLQCGLWLT